MMLVMADKFFGAGIIKKLAAVYNSLWFFKCVINDTCLFIFGLLIVDAMQLVLEGEGHTYSTLSNKWLDIDFRF